jgi:thiamine-monophosphate kinase
MSPRPEFDYIDSLQKLKSFLHPDMRIGIGDDAAVLQPDGSTKEWVVSTDALMEGVDFLITECGPYLAGRKALAVNLSDLAAMAAEPIAAFVSLVIPRAWSMHELQELTRGIHELAEQFSITIAGGDTNSWDGQLVINVTVIGQVTAGQAILRSTAKPGDLIAVTGVLGGSIHGHHLHFTPRITWAQKIKDILSPTSMIDLSDGLSGDLEHILKASEVGAVIEADKIPISEAARLVQSGKTALEHALSDGEDFELLFTFPADLAPQLEALQPEIHCTIIGQITAKKGCFLLTSSGELEPLKATSFTHQFGSKKSS